MDIQDLKERLLALDQIIGSLCHECGFMHAGDPLQVDWNADDPDEAMMYDEFRNIFCHLLYVHRAFSYLQSPVIHSGRLHKDLSGRYTLDELSLKNGTPVEVYSLDSDSQKYKWKLKYINSSSNLQGLNARLRKLQ